MVTPGQILILSYILVGALLHKILPFSKIAWVKWIWNRQHISYFVCHIIDNGSIVNTRVIKESKGEYDYKKGKYVLWVKDGEKQYYPYLRYRGEKVIFHNFNNLSPLIFNAKDIEPAANNPEIFANMIYNHEIGDTLNPMDQQLKPVKRLIVLGVIITVICVTALNYLIFSGMFTDG